MPKAKAHKALAKLGRYRSLGHMMGGFIHQLRTPIHIIQSNVEDLASQPRFLPKVKPQTEMIRRSAERLEASVNALLNFIKGTPISLQPGSINDLVKDLGDYLRAECYKRSVLLEKRLSSKQAIRLDPYLLQEALLNLLTNALQAMPKGGTLVLISEDAPGKVIFQIKDTGVGMNKKTLARLKKPFQTTKRDGMGLGVYFSQDILQKHKAKLTFASERGKGTTATIVFPAA
jgi:signal transduction histidine kinase